VLVFANVMGIWLAGIGAVMAMSAGTALAVAALALLTVNARQFAQRMAISYVARLEKVSFVLALTGGITLTAIGASLLWGSFAAVHPLGL
jgi:ABC-type nickel/cobalt efflux system permease component RcnA